jgi:SAM-dependent methyltransferase
MIMLCQICGNNNTIPYIVKEMMYGSGKQFKYNECPKCGCLQITEIPLDLEQYYPRNYYSFKEINRVKMFLRGRQLAYSLKGPHFLAVLMRHLFSSSRLDLYASGQLDYLKLKRDSRIIDVGCGGGRLVETLSCAGFKHVLGVDPYVETDKAFLTGGRVVKGTLSDVEGSFDCLLFNHSFEHLPNQLATLLQVKRLLAMGGCCVVVMPTTSSYAWLTYRENWVQLDAPRHLCLHSKKSMALLAERASLKVSRVFSFSNGIQFWGSLQYEKGLPLYPLGTSVLRPSSIFSKRELAYYDENAKVLDRLGFGDVAVFTIEKA